ncbi:MAG: right-handed parallel beta-helix repeat-containing protein [Planctomycetota bacterium]
MLHRASLALALLAAPHLAADLVVGPGGSIQAAIDQAVAGDRVVLLPGTYFESIDLKGKAIEVVGRDGAAATELLASATGPVVTLHSGEGPGTRLRGLTIRGGFGGIGGGIAGWVWAGTPPSTAVVEDCVIRENQAHLGGGVAGDLQLVRCVIANNGAGSFSAPGGGGGGVYGGVTMRECAVLNNSVIKGGSAGVLVAGSTPAALFDCLIAGNAGYNLGGGVGVQLNGTATLVGCQITGNSLSAAIFGFSGPGDPGPTQGSGIFAFEGATVAVERCTIANNAGQATSFGEAIGGLGGTMAMSGSIVRNNAGLELDPTSVSASYSNVEGGAPGVGNFDADPLFVNAQGGDYHLTAPSPCIDAGDPTLLDPDGSVADVGAFPFAVLYGRRDVLAAATTPGWSSLSAELGGTHPWRVSLDAGFAGWLYVVLGSVSGTSPGISPFGAALPLVPDGWFVTTLTAAGSSLLPGSVGVLNAAGAADAALVLPPGLAPTGNAWHAALVVDPATLVALASNALPLPLQ